MNDIIGNWSLSEVIMYTGAGSSRSLRLYSMVFFLIHYVSLNGAFTTNGIMSPSFIHSSYFSLNASPRSENERSSKGFGSKSFVSKSKISKVKKEESIQNLDSVIQNKINGVKGLREAINLGNELTQHELLKSKAGFLQKDELEKVKRLWS